MSSGPKREIFNNNERALSTDMNRLQAFAGAHLSELMRALLDTPGGTDDLDAGGVEAPITSQTSPVTAEVMTGLRFVPVGGSTDCSITAGVVGMIDPDATPSADDSPYKILIDPGQANGVLALTSNSSGSTRVDIVECARLGVPSIGGASSTPELVTETANRDIFNSGSGLFTPTTVNKVALQQLQYRIRTGTPGSGIPATVAGWLPLAVVVVPNSTSTWDACTIWDVRPLLADRRLQGGATSQDKAGSVSFQINATTTTAAAGWVDSSIGVGTGTLSTPSNIAGRRVGGRLRRGTPGTDAQSIDLTASINHENGFTPVANTPWYLYMCFPGLPRWARYTDGPTGRVPRAPRGIPVVSATAPDTNGHQIISLNTTIFGHSQLAYGVCVAAGHFDNTAALQGFYGDTASGIMLMDSNSSDGAGVSTLTTNPIDVSGTGTGLGGGARADWTLTAGTHYPPNARALLCEFRATLTDGAGNNTGAFITSAFVEAPNGGGFVAGFGVSTMPKLSGSTGAQNVRRFSLWMPLPTVYPSLTAPTQAFRTHYSDDANNSLAISNAFVRILGWRL